MDGKKELFEYCVILHTKKVGEDKQVTYDPEIIVEKGMGFAMSLEEMNFKVFREIPEEFIDRFNDIVIAIKPF